MLRGDQQRLFYAGPAGFDFYGHAERSREGFEGSLNTMIGVESVNSISRRMCWGIRRARLLPHLAIVATIGCPQR